MKKLVKQLNTLLHVPLKIQKVSKKNWMSSTDDIPLLEQKLTMTYLLKAFGTSKKSVDEEDIKKYKKWTEEFGQEG